MNSNFNSCYLILYLPDTQIILGCFYVFQNPFWSSCQNSSGVLLSSQPCLICQADKHPKNIGHFFA